MITEIRTEESFRYAHELNQQPGQVDVILSWCKSELVGDWRWQLVENSGNSPGRCIFYFDNERDVVAFKLKWF